MIGVVKFLHLIMLNTIAYDDFVHLHVEPIEKTSSTHQKTLCNVKEVF